MNKLLIFAKSPIKEKVKTRLKKDTPLNDDDILKLYTAFLKDIIISASLSKAKKIYIAYYPEDSREVMYDIVFQSSIFNLQSSIELFPQSGNDFDTRLTNAIRYISPHPALSQKGRGKRGGDNIIILGSDSPHIQPSTINRAFKFLSNPPSPPFIKGGNFYSPSLKKRGKGRFEKRWGGIRGAMVLGPSGEGGVYLIGLRYKSSINFRDAFTKGNESDNLLKIARRKKIPLFVLEELTDVDVKSDLITLISNLSMMQYSARNTKILLPRYTINAIKNLGLTISRKGSGTREKYLSLSTF